MELMLRHFTTLSQHKELKMVEKLYRDKRQLCRDKKSRVSIEGQEDFVATKKFYIATKAEKNYKKNVAT